MAFGFTSQPTRKYAYDLVTPYRRDLRDDFGRQVPFEGHQHACNQLWMAHLYHKALVEIERRRRDEANQLVHAVSPTLATLQADAEKMSAEVAALQDELAARNSAARQKGSDRTLANLIKDRKKERAAAWQRYKAAKKAAYKDPTTRRGLDAVDARAHAANKEARDAAILGGLYWGTAGIVTQRVKKTGPPPRFPAWDGSGTLAVQLQRKAVRGSERVPVLDSRGKQRTSRSGKPMTRAVDAKPFGPRELFAVRPQHTGQVALSRRMDGNGQPWGRKQHLLHFRLASDEYSEPVWGVVPIVYHRPLPDDGDIKWVYLTRRKIGTKFRWQVQFDVARPTWEDKCDGRRATTGTVAVALGWRKIGNDLRVATWVGDDGATGHAIIPESRLGAWRASDELQGIRKTNFNADRDALLAWMDGRKLSDEFRTRTKSLHQWRSATRMARLIDWWRGNRFADDAEIFARLAGRQIVAANGRDEYTGGVLQDAHLYDWQEFQRRKCQRWRKWFYQNTAIELSRRYARVVLAEIDWHAIGRAKDIEESEDDINRTNRGIAAVAKLRDELKHRMDATEVSAVNVAAACHRCGAICATSGKMRYITCEGCGGLQWDRAENAARNMLRIALQPPPASDAARGLEEVA